MLIHRRRPIGGHSVTEFAHAAEGHRRELLLHCYRMLGSLPDAEDAVQETMLRAWRYRDSLKEGAPLRPWLYRVATNACLDAIARDERRAVLAAKVAADDGAAGKLDDVVWLRPIPDSQLEPPTPPPSTPEAITVTRETIEIAFLTVIQLLTPQQRAALILCDVLDWSAKEAADLLDITVPAVNSSLQRARARLRERLPSRRAKRRTFVHWNPSFAQTRPSACRRSQAWPKAVMRCSACGSPADSAPNGSAVSAAL
jgi:RNA polymerase sigma-70 factor, ECF subfamily